MKKNKLLMSALLLTTACTGMAQSLEKMQWFNEPDKWEIKDNTLIMGVTPQSDYWPITLRFHCGRCSVSLHYSWGEFEVKVKGSGDYKVRFDQAGFMLRIDHEKYIKAGIEFVDGKYNLGTVGTHHTVIGA